MKLLMSDKDDTGTTVPIQSGDIAVFDTKNGTIRFEKTRPEINGTLAFTNKYCERPYVGPPILVMEILADALGLKFESLLRYSHESHYVAYTLI